MKTYLITATFHDGGVHSREVQAKNKKAAEEDFMSDIPDSVKAKIEKLTNEIKK